MICVSIVKPRPEVCFEAAAAVVLLEGLPCQKESLPIYDRVRLPIV